MLAPVDVVRKPEVLVHVEDVHILGQLVADCEAKPRLELHRRLLQRDRLSSRVAERHLQGVVDVVARDVRELRRMLVREQVADELLDDVAVAGHEDRLDRGQVLHEVQLAVHHVQQALVDQFGLHMHASDDALVDGQVHWHLDFRRRFIHLGDLCLLLLARMLLEGLV